MSIVLKIVLFIFLLPLGAGIIYRSVDRIYASAVEYRSATGKDVCSLVATFLVAFFAVAFALFFFVAFFFAIKSFSVFILAVLITNAIVLRN